MMVHTNKFDATMMYRSLHAIVWAIHFQTSFATIGQLALAHQQQQQQQRRYQ
jgi:hypothetical protein